MPNSCGGFLNVEGPYPGAWRFAGRWLCRRCSRPDSYRPARSRFRVWIVDNALHGDVERQEDPARTVSYVGVLHEALRELVAWVEQGRPPLASTRYRAMLQ